MDMSCSHAAPALHTSLLVTGNRNSTPFFAGSASLEVPLQCMDNTTPQHPTLVCTIIHWITPKATQPPLCLMTTLGSLHQWPTSASTRKVPPQTFRPTQTVLKAFQDPGLFSSSISPDASQVTLLTTGRTSKDGQAIWPQRHKCCSSPVSLMTLRGMSKYNQNKQDSSLFLTLGAADVATV